MRPKKNSNAKKMRAIKGAVSQLAIWISINENSKSSIGNNFRYAEIRNVIPSKMETLPFKIEILDIG